MHVLLFSAFLHDFPKIKGFQIGNQAITWILGMISKSPGRQSLQNQIIFQMVYNNPSFIMSPHRVLLLKTRVYWKYPNLLEHFIITFQAYNIYKKKDKLNKPYLQ